MDLRISSNIVTRLNRSQSSNPHRDLYIDFSLHNNTITRQELSGYYYVTYRDGTRQVFTFSPSTLHPYDHAGFRQFVADLKLRRECTFNFESAGRFTGFTYKSNTLTFSSGHDTNCMSVFLKCTDAVVKDLEELSQTVDRYMELCRDRDIETVEQVLKKTMSG